MNEPTHARREIEREREESAYIYAYLPETHHHRQLWWGASSIRPGRQDTG